MAVPDGRAESADTGNERALDAMFAALEREPFLEGYKTDIVGGAVHMTPQRSNHWDITWGVLRQLRPKYDHRILLSDVRVDYPGELNAFCSDVALVAEGAERTKPRSRREISL
ncbi:Uma2 family endonuclease OS=Streptomyces alboniger OX=132473 GN=CP975_15505 PE=4 SV=1 [Streptomyces alboniger]